MLACMCPACHAPSSWKRRPLGKSNKIHTKTCMIGETQTVRSKLRLHELKIHLKTNYHNLRERAKTGKSVDRNNTDILLCDMLDWIHHWLWWVTAMMRDFDGLACWICSKANALVDCCFRQWYTHRSLSHAHLNSSKKGLTRLKPCSYLEMFIFFVVPANVQGRNSLLCVIVGRFTRGVVTKEHVYIERVFICVVNIGWDLHKHTLLITTHT